MIHRIVVITEKEAVCNIYTDEESANTCQPPLSTYNIAVSANHDQVFTNLGFTLTQYSWQK